MKILWKNSNSYNGILGINERNLNYVYNLNPRKHFKLADDKVLSKEILEKNNIPCPKTYGVIRAVGDIHKMWKQISIHDKLVIKPSQGSGGNGILILAKRKDGMWYSQNTLCTHDDIFSHMARIIMGMYSKSSSDKVLIEQYIDSDDFFKRIYPSGVPDIRVIMAYDKAVMAMLRLPTDRSGGKANLHQGGLGVGIDISSGRLLMAYDGSNYSSIHPDTGNKISDMFIPHWNRLLNIAFNTSKIFPLDYLGVDIILDKIIGPIVMEINVRPGLGIQLANKQGLKTMFKKLK